MEHVADPESIRTGSAYFSTLSYAPRCEGGSQSQRDFDGYLRDAEAADNVARMTE